MAKILLLDSNVIIDFANKKPGTVNLDALIAEHKCATSFIVKLETLGFSDITKKKKEQLRDYCQNCRYCPQMRLLKPKPYKSGEKQN
ncbi:hypothetical protein FACS1894172_10410 [Spirochaetia bacterium]|nr:hypothetical protein FACS1894164_10560 [Spirochaetia bacterium]GHU32914.1 hypothetical protein FACS1894172_10410 [Spirochaetia bacterium]